jgi:hypothetical protein
MSLENSIARSLVLIKVAYTATKLLQVVGHDSFNRARLVRAAVSARLALYFGDRRGRKTSGRESPVTTFDLSRTCCPSG